MQRAGKAAHFGRVALTTSVTLPPFEFASTNPKSTTEENPNQTGEGGGRGMGDETLLREPSSQS